MMRKAMIRLTAAMAVVLVALGATVATNAQWNQRYWNSMRKADVEKVIARLERNANDFRRDLDRWLDYSRINNTEREDRYNGRVKAFEQATNRLRSEFDRRDQWWETREQVQDVMNNAKPIAEFMRRGRYSRDLQNQWWTLRRQLNKLATTYRLSQIS